MYDRRKEDLNCVHKLKIHLERFNSTGDIVVVMDRIDTNECPFILTQKHSIELNQDLNVAMTV